MTSQATSFWSNKPLSITKEKTVSTILPIPELLQKITTDISLSKIQLDYSIITDLNDDKMNSIISFINDHYSNDGLSLRYSTNLFSYYSKNAIIIEFYPKHKSNVIGYVVGSKITLNIFNMIYDSVGVNFLCLVPALRNMGVSSYMINVLTKEIINHFPTIVMAHYTISTKISSPCFGKKNFYHRILNVPKLCEAGFTDEQDTSKLQSIYNVFHYDCKYRRNYRILYNPSNMTIIMELYTKYNNYAKTNYDIYERISLEEFEKTFHNKAFHHFVVYKNDAMDSYVCMFELEVYNMNNRKGYKTGFFYYMFFGGEENIANTLEFIHEYVYKNDILDLTTYTDIFKIHHKKLKCVEGSGSLNYYLYNVNCCKIPNYRNGLITV
jgi:hypothetical protein